MFNSFRIAAGVSLGTGIMQLILRTCVPAKFGHCAQRDGVMEVAPRTSRRNLVLGQFSMF